jgi:hypothetical protein
MIADLGLGGPNGHRSWRRGASLLRFLELWLIARKDYYGLADVGQQASFTRKIGFPLSTGT